MPARLSTKKKEARDEITFKLYDRNDMFVLKRTRGNFPIQVGDGGRGTKLLRNEPNCARYRLKEALGSKSYWCQKKINIAITVGRHDRLVEVRQSQLFHSRFELDNEPKSCALSCQQPTKVNTKKHRVILFSMTLACYLVYDHLIIIIGDDQVPKS